MNNAFLAKIILLAAFAGLLGLFFWFDLASYLNFAQLKTSLDSLLQWQQQQPLLAGAIYFAIYTLATAASLPGAAILTLAGGAIFGFVQGLVLVSFASSLGATLAFLATRFVLADWVRSKFGQKLRTIDEGVKRDGAFYLFSLRLVPVVPFFLINLLMALTPMRAITFYWVSQVGMLLGTAVYVNAGTQLAGIESPGEILSPGVLLSFVLLAMFPWIARMLTNRIKSRRVYRGWSKPKKFDRNLIVIGAGAGGLVSAYIGAAAKARVTLVEGAAMGGDCLNTGCVPSKALIKSAHIAHQMRHAERWGIKNQAPEFEFSGLMRRVQNVIQKIEPHDSPERYRSLGVDVVQGWAKLVDPWTVEIKQHNGEVQRLTAQSIILATGAQPFVPPLEGLDHSNCLTSDNLWQAMANRDAPPRRLLVLGGGPIGCELAQAFARLGSQVTQVEMAPRLLTKEDTEVADAVAHSLRSEGVQVLTGHKALRVVQHEGNRELVVQGPAGEQSIVFDELLCAVGRRARLSGYGLEELGINTGKPLAVNQYLQTLFPNIYAVGDLVGHYQFTHAAAHQAWYAAVNALFGRWKKFRVDYRVMPWVTFTEPQVARVGLNEQDAAEQGIQVEVTRYGLDDLDRAITESEAEGFIKVLTPPGKDKILGVTLYGSHAGEMLPEFVLAMKHGLGLNKILGTIHPYPTWAEGNKYAAGEWKRAHAPQKLLQWVGRYHARHLKH